MQDFKPYFKRSLLILVVVAFIILLGEIPATAQSKEYLFNPLKQYLTKPLEEAFPKLELRGYLINETDILLHNIGDEPITKPSNAPGRHFEIKQNFQRIEWLAELRYKYHFTGNLMLIGQLDFLYDASFDWQGSALGRNQSPERELESFRTSRRWFREGYLLWNPGNWEFRLGKQQVVWGKATDIGHWVDQVHGFDFREIHDTGVDDTELTRRTVWMANIQYFFRETFLGDLDIQLLWIPDYEENIYAPSPYLQSPSFIFRNLMKALRFLKTDRPSASFKNHEWGLRLSTLTGAGWDFELYYLYLWDRSPTNFIKAIDGAAFRAGRPWIIIEPKPARIHMIGVSFEKNYSFGVDNEWIFRGEAAYFINRYRSTRNESPSRSDILSGSLAPWKDGVNKGNEMRWALNAETYFKPPLVAGPPDWLFTAWLGVFNYFNHDNDLTQGAAPLKKWTTLVLAGVSKNFWNDKASFKVSMGYEEGGSWRFSGPTFSYEITDDLYIAVGYTGYSGKKDKIGGWGDRNFEEIQLEFNYSF